MSPDSLTAYEFSLQPREGVPLPPFTDRETEAHGHKLSVEGSQIFRDSCPAFSCCFFPKSIPLPPSPHQTFLQLPRDPQKGLPPRYAWGTEKGDEMGKREAISGSGRWPWLPTAWVGVTQVFEGWGLGQVAFMAHTLGLEEIPEKAGLELGSLLPRPGASPGSAGGFWGTELAFCLPWGYLVCFWGSLNVPGL